MQALPQARTQAGAHGYFTAVAPLLLAVSLSNASAAHVHSLQGVSRAVPRHMLGHPRRLLCQRSRRSVCGQLVYLRVKGSSRCALVIDVDCSVPCPNTERVKRCFKAGCRRNAEERRRARPSLWRRSVLQLLHLCPKQRVCNSCFEILPSHSAKPHCTLTCCLCGQLLYLRCARGPRRFAHHR